MKARVVVEVEGQFTEAQAATIVRANLPIRHPGGFRLLAPGISSLAEPVKLAATVKEFSRVTEYMRRSRGEQTVDLSGLTPGQANAVRALVRNLLNV